MDDIHSILLKYWGYKQFRPIQEDIILSVMKGKDTLALLPTGGGKSLCFQVPTLAMDGICVVISPLIALMKDQVENLTKRDIPAAAIVSGMSAREIELVYNKALTHQLKFLYVSPERLKTRAFLENIHRMQVCLIAVDEAHCISQWGYDFRPPYLQIADLRNYLSKVPFIALTATATTEVVKDIQEKLAFNDAAVFQKSFARENLTYYVFKEEDKRGRMLRIIHRIGGSGIIYVRNRRKTNEIANFLCQQGVSATCYHAGLESALRNKRQADWIAGKTPVIVATNAFGMGIDKPDCRFVIHLDLPDSLEAYFQEAGRAGRDGLRAHAIILYENLDILNLEKSFADTYPPIHFVKEVYNLLCDYFKIPLGAGTQLSFDFELSRFVQEMQLAPTSTYHALKILEMQGLIAFSEDLGQKSRVMITASSDEVYNFQVKNDSYGRVMEALIRTYGGLYSDYVKIQEGVLARKVNISEEQMTIALQNLVKWNMVDYIPAPHKPQMFLLSERIPTDKFLISPEVYQERKNNARKRLDAVTNYAENTHKCRSQMLLAYFGENKSARCGFCDFCIERNKVPLNDADLQEIKAKLQSLLTKKAFSVEQIREILAEYSEPKILQALEYLLDTTEMYIDKSGKYHWRN